MDVINIRNASCMFVRFVPGFEARAFKKAKHCVPS